MRCRKVEKLLTRFLDGELPEETRTAVAGHVEACEECGRQLAEAKKVLAWAGSWRARQPSAHFLTRLKARIRAGEEPATQPRSLWLSPRRLAFAGAATMCVVFLAGYFAGMLLSPEKQQPAPGQGLLTRRTPPGTAVAAAKGDSRPQILGLQRIKMVFGSKLSEAAYEQLNEVQQVLAARDASGKDLAMVKELQRAEQLVRQERYVEAQEVLEGLEQQDPAHPLVAYARMTRILAEPEHGYGSDLVRTLYAGLLRETVGDPNEFYSQVSAFPTRMAEMREYGWKKIVESAEQLNPLNTLNYIERRLAGGGTTL